MNREERKEDTSFKNSVKRLEKLHPGSVIEKEGFDEPGNDEPDGEDPVDQHPTPTPSAEYLAEIEKDKDFMASHFGIPREEALWYHSGICYSRCGVNTKSAADKVSEKVKGDTANGGMLHGMPLGGQQHHPGKPDRYDGKEWWEVYC